MIKPEQYIENRLIRHRGRLGYKDSLVIRRVKMGRGGFGFVDVMFLPVTGPHRLVLAEVKQKNSGDAAGKVVGQALLYYAAALSIGLDGLEVLRRYARKNRRTAKRARPKSLQMLSGGLRPPEDWLALQAGRKLKPSEIALIVGLSEHPRTVCAPCSQLSESTTGSTLPWRSLTAIAI